MQDLLGGPVGSEAPTGTAAAAAQVAGQARIARRGLLKAAVFGPQARHHASNHAPQARGDTGNHAPGLLPRAVTGEVLDASPQVLVIGNGETEERFALAAGASAWRGAKTDPAAIKIGDHAVVRRHDSGREVADRIWANIGRVTGTIVQRNRDTLVVDGGGAALQTLVIARQAAGKIQVRFPRLEPGYLVDIIGVRHDGFLEGLIPATSQPPYRADHVPVPPLVNGHVPAAIRGSAIWHEPGNEPPSLIGATYPAVDLQGASPPESARGCVSLPYLSVGSLLRVQNDCTGSSRVLPVIGPAALARLFCDRSVICGPSPRGRIADLTLASFVELGGELDEGCFNATIEIEG